MKIHTCDCGRRAYRKDGSGWFCRECEIAVAICNAELDRHIQRKRYEEKVAAGLVPDQDRKEYMRQYWYTHKSKLADYYKEWAKMRQRKYVMA
jgi:predicted amidophosphoribosyltransferase